MYMYVGMEWDSMIQVAAMCGIHQKSLNCSKTTVFLIIFRRFNDDANEERYLHRG